MIIHKAELLLQKKEAKKLQKKSVIPSDATIELSTPFKVLDEAGETLILSVPSALNADDYIENALAKIKYQKTKRSGGLKTTSRIFGYQPKNVFRSRHFANRASLDSEMPSVAAKIYSAGEEAARIYKEEVPALYRHHEELTSQVLPEYKILSTPFTSGIVNWNNNLKYHFDAGNFRNVFSVMFIHYSQVLGGELICPEYGLKLKLAHNSVLLFDGQSILHGVTPIQLMNASSFRYTTVFYSLFNLMKAKSPIEELAFARSKEMEKLQ